MSGHAPRCAATPTPRRGTSLERLTRLETDGASGYLDLAADGDMSRAELRDKLAEVDRLRGETEGALRSARGRQESMEEFKRAWSFVDKQLLQMTDGLSYLLASPADRRRLYMGLQLRADVHADGTIRISGIFDPEIILLDLVQDPPTDPSEPEPEPLEGARVVTTPYTFNVTNWEHPKASFHGHCGPGAGDAAICGLKVRLGVGFFTHACPPPCAYRTAAASSSRHRAADPR